jgi:tRNA modification GTPase
MFSPEDTIVAIATPPGRGGLGVVRISGPQALTIASAVTTRQAPLEARRATFTRLRAMNTEGASAGQSRGNALAPADHVVVTSFPAPHSYTGQEVVEISAHGSPVVLRAIVATAIDAGARLAQPGEFTLRAFLAGKVDLVQAEAVADLIAAVTPLQARVAFDQLEGTLTRRIAAIDDELFDLIAKLEASLDFPDEGYHFIDATQIAERLGCVVERLDRLLADAGRGRMIREGATVAIVGRTNVGKSSIFNALAGIDRAIVTAVPGTTRDLITERVDVGGIPLTLIDTAGRRDTLDIVEREGVARGARAGEVAEVIVVVVDGSEPLTEDDETLLEETAARNRVLVLNKSDRPGRFDMAGALRISATRGDGMSELRGAIASALTSGEPLRDTAVVSNVRHILLLQEAREHLRRGRAAAIGGATEEFVLVDLQAARARFDEIVGTRTTDDVLARIFERFCVGK